MHRTRTPRARHGRTAATLLLALTLTACETVEESGRSQFVLPGLDETFMAELGAEAYAEATAGYRVVTGAPEAEMVERTGRRIAAASGRDYAWELRFLDAPDVVNAFCLPGGKVAVLSGILPVCGDEDSLAAVVVPKVAHATSHHGAERMSHRILAEVLQAAGEPASRRRTGARTRAWRRSARSQRRCHARGGSRRRPSCRRSSGRSP